MISILSPAKKLNTSIQPKDVNLASQAVFIEDSVKLMAKLKKMSAKKIATFMKVNSAIASMNHEWFEQWSENHTLSNSQFAIETFNGEVYNGFDALTLTEELKPFAQQHVRILSGLYGVLRPYDLIQPYRLEMGKKLKVGRADDLYAFWKNKIQQELIRVVEESGSNYIVNLASNEYAKAARLKETGVPVISCQFKEKKGNDYKTVMVYAKKARGMMARFIVDNQINKPEQLIAFDTNGYLYNKSLSTTEDLIFTRN